MKRHLWWILLAIYLGLVLLLLLPNKCSKEDVEQDPITTPAPPVAAIGDNPNIEGPDDPTPPGTGNNDDNDPPSNNNDTTPPENEDRNNTEPTPPEDTDDTPPIPGDGENNDVDLNIALKWNTNADLDLSIREPNGNIISIKDKESSSGGKMDRDDRGDSTTSIERIYWREDAPKGEYEISVEYRPKSNMTETVEPTLFEIHIAGADQSRLDGELDTPLTRKTFTLNKE